jgi:hypothetical protein
VCEPPASLAGAERQRRVEARHPARLERKRTATLVSSVSSVHSRLFRLAVRSLLTESRYTIGGQPPAAEGGWHSTLRVCLPLNRGY